MKQERLEYVVQKLVKPNCYGGSWNDESRHNDEVEALAVAKTRTEILRNSRRAIRRIVVEQILPIEGEA